jgi:hypothetical protein
MTLRGVVSVMKAIGWGLMFGDVCGSAALPVVAGANERCKTGRTTRRSQHYLKSIGLEDDGRESTALSQARVRDNLESLVTGRATVCRQNGTPADVFRKQRRPQKSCAESRHGLGGHC